MKRIKFRNPQSELENYGPKGEVCLRVDLYAFPGNNILRLKSAEKEEGYSGSMIRLLGLEEMQWRHEKGEDPFALAIEKWLRIREFLLEKADLARYKEAFQCGSTKILFCLDYKTYCSPCPLVGVCHDSQSLYYQIMRHLQAYTLAGTHLPRGPLIELIDFYIRDLEGYRRDWLKKSH